jgi:predicted dehydrogenase
VSAPTAGIIGTGFMGRVHANALRHAGITISRVASSSADRARDAVSPLYARGWSESPERLIADPAVDVVHICTPNDAHANYAQLAIAAGKGVVCEKPLATSVADAEDLVERAADAGVVTAVPFVYRFYPAVREARDRVMSGSAGRVLLIHGSYLQDWLADQGRTDWRVDSARGGTSRAFADIGVHWCDLVEFITGHRIVRLCASTARAFESRSIDGAPVTTEDSASMLFSTDRGASGVMLASQISLGRKNHLVLSIDGAGEALAFDQENPNSLWVGGSTENRTLPSGSPTWSPEGSRLSVLPPGHPQGYQDCFNGFMADAYRAQTGVPVDGLPTFLDGLRSALLTDAVLRSAAADRWVDVCASKV